MPTDLSAGIINPGMDTTQPPRVSTMPTMPSVQHHLHHPHHPHRLRHRREGLLSRTLMVEFNWSKQDEFRMEEESMVKKKHLRVPDSTYRHHT